MFLSLMVVACLTVPATAQTTQPEPVDHAALVEQAAANPLMPELLVSSKGEPLSEDEITQFGEAMKYMLSARQARDAGDFKAAAESSQKAEEIYTRILGTLNHNTITAMVFRRTASQIASASTEAQGAMAQAYKKLKAAEDAHDQGDYAEAARSAQQALTTFELTLGNKHGALVPVLRTLGAAQLELQRFNDAAVSFDRAIELGEAVYGQSHPQIAATLDRQGWMLLNTRKFKEAIEALTRAVRIYSSSVGETAELAEALDNLGTALMYARDGQRALSSKLRAYVIRNRILGPEARDTAVSLSNIAWLYSKIGGPTSKEVIPLRKRAVAIFAKQLGPDHPYTSLEKANLAQDYLSQNQPQEALTLYEELVALDRQHPDKLDVMAVSRLVTLGRLYIELDRLKDALLQFNKAFEAGKVLHDKGEVEAAIVQLQGLATTYLQRRMFDDAVPVFETIQKWSERRNVEPDSDDIRRMLQLGNIYIELGRLQDAQTILTSAVQAADKLHGDDSPKSGFPRLALSLAFEKAADWPNAERFAEEALRIAEKKLHAKHLLHGHALAAVGRVQMKRGNLDLAKFSLGEAKAIFESQRNSNAAPIAHIQLLQDLAACHGEAGEIDEALKFSRLAVDKARYLISTSEGRNLTAQASLADAIKQLSNHLDKDPAAKKESAQLREELKQILMRLRENRALSKEHKIWLNEL